MPTLRRRSAADHNGSVLTGTTSGGVGVAETLLTVSPGCSNFASVLNVASQPIQFAKGTVIGHIEELKPDTTVETVASYEEAQQAAAGAHTAQSAAGVIYSSTQPPNPRQVQIRPACGAFSRFQAAEKHGSVEDEAAGSQATSFGAATSLLRSVSSGSRHASPRPN